MTFNKHDLRRFEGYGVPDLVAEGCRLLIVGINPGLWTAASGVHFAHPTNRFWPAMRRAGLVEAEPHITPFAPAVPIAGPDYPGQTVSELWSSKSRILDDVAGSGPGMTPEVRDSLIASGIGITNLVSRATARASELTTGELRQGAIRLRSLADRIGPKVLAVAGVTAYRTAFGVRDAVIGGQPEGIGAADLWVVPNPSGLNAHETVESLASWYRKIAEAAGVV